MMRLCRARTCLRAVLLFGALGPAVAIGQSIVTVAGGGQDDGRAATAVSVGTPAAVLVDATGSLVFSDTARVRRVDDRTGLITTVAGDGTDGFTGDGGPATAAALSSPCGLAWGADGSLFIADRWNQRIRKVEVSTGIITTIAGNGNLFNSGDGGPATEASLFLPVGLAMTGGRVYVSTDHRIRSIDLSTGLITTVAGTDQGFAGDEGPATRAQLRYPDGLAVDGQGRLLVADAGNGRVRRIDLATGLITTVAGGGSGPGLDDGAPATQARLRYPDGIAVSASGDLVIADESDHRVRRVDAASGLIFTVAGTGGTGSTGDGGPATLAELDAPVGVAIDPAGRVIVVDINGNRVRRVDGAGIITTVAGDGTYSFLGDGGPATAAGLAWPSDLAFDADGNLLIVSSLDDRIRKVDGRTGTIMTVAGGGSREGVAADGGPATEASLGYPHGVVPYPDGGFAFSEYVGGKLRRVAGKTGIITTVGGGGQDLFGGDGGPATAASFFLPYGLALDEALDLFVADSANDRVRKIDGRTGIVTTVAGGGEASEDGVLATQAFLNEPDDVLIDVAGDLLVADGMGGKVRKVSRATGTITTVAGGGFGGPGDGGPATRAHLSGPNGVALDAFGNLAVADQLDARVRRVDAKTGIITTVAGSGSAGYTGDRGPATKAGLGEPDAVAFNTAGDLYIADFYANRIRAVFACRDRLGAFDSSYPNDGSAANTAGLALSWSGADSAFRYDVLVDTDFPPKRVLQQAVTGQGIQISGLEPGKTYYWQIRAKGDPYCPGIERTSGIRRFTTTNPCSSPPAAAVQIPSVSGTTATLTFSPVAGAVSYDIYFGTGGSVALVASGLTTNTYTATGLQPGTTYRYRVVAHAACNPDLVSSSPESTFAVSGSCVAPGPVEITSPTTGASGLAPSLDLSWRAVSGASSYDIYLGAAPDPPLYVSGLTAPALSVSLDPGKSYSVRVVAHAACDSAKTSSSPTRTFATAPGSSCPAPASPSGLSSTKTSAFLGSTYTLSWRRVSGGALYRVERTKAGDTSPEAFTTSDTSLLLRASEKTSYSHRVTALSPCGTASQPSSDLIVAVSSAPPFLTITNPPKATVIRQPQPGLPLSRLEVEVRNTGRSDFVGFFNTSQTVPFFIMSETAVSLRPGEIRVFFLQFSGVPLDQPGVYDGLLTLQSADPTDGTAFPQIAISLKVTGLKPTDPIPSTTPPAFLQGGAPIEYVRFAPTLEGSQPPDILVDLKNPGSTPLDLAADVLPDSWVSISEASSASAWNATPIAPGSTRTLRLTAQRIRGASGGTFPRYAYLTVRTVDSKSSRLLIQDSDATTSGLCPGRSVLAASESSLIVPSLVNASAKGGGRYVSKLLISNLDPDVAQADLYYTPDTGDPGTNGFDCTKVLFASLIVPGNDVIALTDPIGQLFNTEGSGQLEIRSSRIGQLRVQSVVDAPAQGGGSYGFQLPTVRSGEGARQNAPYSVLGIQQDSTYRTNLILTETSGEPSSVTVTLYDRTGKPLGSTQRDLPPYGKKQFAVSDLASAGTTLSAGALEITANPGSAGSVTGVITVIDGRTGDASSFLAKPLKNPTSSTSYAIPSVVVSNTFKSRVEIRNNDTRPVSYTLRYKGSTGNVSSAPRTLNPKAEDAWQSVLEEVFNLPPTSFGPLFIDSDSPNLSVVSRVYSEQPTGSYGDAIEGYALDDPTTTGESGRIVLTDGLEGTADNDKSRGARTNLIMAEIGGGTADLEVSIWEKTQRRVAPVGTITVHLGPNEQKQINDIFGNEGFGIGQKDRLNVLCAIRPKAGTTGKVIALATRIDNKTNDTKNLVLRP